MSTTRARWSTPSAIRAIISAEKAKVVIANDESINRTEIEIEEEAAVFFRLGGGLKILDWAFIRVYFELTTDVNAYPGPVLVLLAPGQPGLRVNVTADEVARNVFAHPTLSEAVKEAVEGIVGHMINF